MEEKLLIQSHDMLYFDSKNMMRISGLLGNNCVVAWDTVTLPLNWRAYYDQLCILHDVSLPHLNMI